MTVYYQGENSAEWPPPGIKWYYSDDSAAIAYSDCREILPLRRKSSPRRRGEQETSVSETRIEFICNPGHEHNVYQQMPGARDFIVFNDGDLSMEPVTDADIRVAKTPPGFWCESAAWSCNVEWYFVVTEAGILLLNVYSREGFYCEKKSARFIEAFLDAPYRKRRNTSRA